ncbi:helix-turn-helix domain-containing protein [Psychroflexus tropicus]|uniref:helix-turn-helix domain-containing protein n=1 Tax=Psychroflexus tropicus TaxID=197345 RepID=UPI0003816A65|nr:helix-turn-helix transcriptional regulator [Psychroflexus tropicus]
MSSFGKKLSECRQAKNRSQKDLANLLSTSYSVVGKYECNGAVPSVGTAKNIAEVFDVSLDYMEGDTPKPSFDKRMM